MPKINYEKLLRNISIDEVAKKLGMELTQETPTRFKALCPFHDDKTPSLLIDSSRDSGRQHFYCFACGEHGDAIDLVKQKLGFGFKSAVDWLAPGASTVVGRRSLTTARKVSATKPDNRAGLELAYQLYRHHANAAEFGSWTEKRHLHEEVLRRAGYVYAVANSLSINLDSQQDSSTKREQIGLLEDAFLIRKLIPGVRPDYHLPLSSHYKDFFIGSRVVFPLYSENGILLGLGGRAVGHHVGTIPKYQFTRGFPKATMLYRADFAFERIRNAAQQGAKHVYLYLCEGFLDALRIEALGMHAVAIMGSSISEPHLKLLQSLSDELKDCLLTIVVCFDRDEAGLRGAADTCLKLLRVPIECKFLWPNEVQLSKAGFDPTSAKDPNDYLQDLSSAVAAQLMAVATHPPELAVLANTFGVSAEDTLNNDRWALAPRSRRYRAFSRALSALKKLGTRGTEALVRYMPDVDQGPGTVISALAEWRGFIAESRTNSHPSLAEEFLTDTHARLNHARILAYMGSRRGELPCDEPRWERMDIAATAFNALLIDQLGSTRSAPTGPYDAVWVPRSFGGGEPRLKMMPRAEDLTIHQYLLNEILTERWDRNSFAEAFSNRIPAVRYYREERVTRTTGFDAKGDGNWSEHGGRTLSFAYQIDMDVLEGRQPSSDQGMYRPFIDCWRDFMKSLSDQAAGIGYVYSIRLDVKRYYDRLRRYVVRDRLLSRLEDAVESVTGATPGFAELLEFESAMPSAASKAATVLDRIDEQLFGVSYRKPDTGLEDKTDPLVGIPQGPVLSAWIGSVALFPVDEEAYRFMERHNTDRDRVGYARYVDDIVLLADSPSTLMEMREEIDRCARKLELTLLAKADEIPAMSAEDFSIYVNQGRALAAYGPAWEPPLVGDGESGWEFWSVAPTTDRQSALQLLHNVELYKATPTTLIQTVFTAFHAPDLRASELPKAARLIWYSIATLRADNDALVSSIAIWTEYMQLWKECLYGASWQLLPEKHAWESPLLFALEGLEHLLDTTPRDVAELSAEENEKRRKNIFWLATLCLTPKFLNENAGYSSSPTYQTEARFRLIQWKALRITGRERKSDVRLKAERSKLFRHWNPLEWLHEAVVLLSEANTSQRDQLLPFVDPMTVQARQQPMSGLGEQILRALLPKAEGDVERLNPDVGGGVSTNANRIALQTLVSIVPKAHLANCLNQRPWLIWNKPTSENPNRISIPPLPGISTSRLLCCSGDNPDDTGMTLIRRIEIINFDPKPDCDGTMGPTFIGADGSNVHLLSPLWRNIDVEGANALFVKLEADLVGDKCLRLRERIEAAKHDISGQDLRQVATLFRAIAQILLTHGRENIDQELVPAWPYIAVDASDQLVYLFGESVSKSELGNRAFVRDGGRALRTVEVPIFEAHLWRVGIAISDYFGLHDDVAKFSSIDLDVTLNAEALANPARYLLRAQLRKLRGAYADSNLGKRRDNHGDLPASVDRSLKLLESYPSATSDPLGPVFHILAAEAESAGMYLSIRESWGPSDIATFLSDLSGRVLARLPLSIGKALASSANKDREHRRDLTGLICFARRLFAADESLFVVNTPAWKALCAGVVSAGISCAIGGVLASIRSHGGFERYANFDFPIDWDVPRGEPALEAHAKHEVTDSGVGNQLVKRSSLLEKLRRLVQHLGHRMREGGNRADQLSDEVLDQLKKLTKTAVEIESMHADGDYFLEWPFTLLRRQSVALLDLGLLETVAALVKRIDEELGFEVSLVMEKSYGYNAQTRRFTDSRNGVCEVTPWMISQFPRNANHIEEVNDDGRFLRIWSEVFDRRNNKLLSISVLGEPFASIAIEKPVLAVSRLNKEAETQTNSHAQTDGYSAPDRTPADAGGDGSLGADYDALSGGVSDDSSRRRNVDSSVPKLDGYAKTSGTNPARENAYEFQKRQREQWAKRGKHSKQNGHVRVALLQANMDLTYSHPFVEACPANWPFSAATKSTITDLLKGDPVYGPLLSASSRPDSAHLWAGIADELKDLPSWAEHRRQRILGRVIDACESFDVDLLVLPEYAVRIETIEWLKVYLANKDLSVLAGTYMEFRRKPEVTTLAAPLKLLWPLPKGVASLLAASLSSNTVSTDDANDFLERGLVFEFSRNKKYRSIALEEFFCPPRGTLAPLFIPRNVAAALHEAVQKAAPEHIGFDLPQNVLIELLTGTRLPLKHFLELICSEVFLISNPANYLHMYEDLRAIRSRFGELSDSKEVFEDVEVLSRLLSITGDGVSTRRSILAVPAATSRSADYWIAGQASFLAAGTTTVFCNAIDGKTLVGGSCFIGKGSWKVDDGAIGYIARVTPYHGWSKGIFYNDKKDALSSKDQAVIIADIDPHNMLEGKPRAQTMPSPLQLVAYLPISESAEWTSTARNLIRELRLSVEAPIDKPEDEASFWNAVHDSHGQQSTGHFQKLWTKFSDEKSLAARAKAFVDNGAMQPSGALSPSGLISTAALYDWIYVSLTLGDQQALPRIDVPSWKRRNA